VFEDSASGIRSATEAGCHVVTVDAPADLPSLVTTELTRNQV
jgi:beta-phosphoglucomutase-like phosphatase (HAD superfamily)